MNKIKHDDSDIEPDFDLKQGFYRTFQENHLDFLCTPDEIVLDHDPLKKLYDPQNESYMLEPKDNSFINQSNTPFKQDSCPTPIHLKLYQKFDINNSMRNGDFLQSGHDEVFETWTYPKQNIMKNNREFEKFQNNDNFRQNNEFPLSSLWSGGGDNSKSYKRNYECFNGNSQYHEDFYDKKVKFNNESNDYETGSFNGKSPINQINQGRDSNNQAQTHEGYNNNNNYQAFPEKIQFHLFKKSAPMYNRITQPPMPTYTPLKHETNGKVNEDTPSRSSRGLRVLSMKVKDIVSKKEKVTYKEVAESLVQELELKPEENENSKDEQNIKRRVYDALNVLIAADILKKKGKQVFSDECSSFTGHKIKRNSMEEKHSLEQNIEMMKQTISEKEALLQEILLKTLSLKNLISRNMEYDSNNEKIHFPFIALELDCDPIRNSTEIVSNKQKTYMKILSREPFQIYGDIDILLKLGLFRTDKRRLEELFSKELHQYFPNEIYSLKIE